MNAAVINKNAKLQRVPEACADTNWSRNTLMKVAAEANERYLSQEKSNYGPLSQTVLFNIGEKGAEFTGFSDKHDADYVGMRDYERRQAPQRADHT